MTAQAGDTFSNSIAAQKRALRRHLRSGRAALGAAQRSLAARLTAKRLCRLRRVRRARRLAVYLSMHSEVDTAPLIDALLRRGQKLFAPCVDRSGKMRFVPLRSRKSLRRDALGLRRPQASGPLCSVRRFDIVILPLVGFDLQGGRLGMGGGFYDRSFAPIRFSSKPWRVGYAFDCQQVERLPIEPWDLRLHAVALAHGVRRLQQH